MKTFLLSVSLLLTASLPSSSAPGGRRAPARSAPALGEFAQETTLTGTVSGQAFTWKGIITFSPVNNPALRKITGKGDFTLGVPPPPPPPPVPLALSYLSMTPAAVLSGQTATVTVVLNRAPGVAVQIPLKSADPTTATVAESVTIQPAQTSGTAAVLAQSVTAVRLVAINATYNGQSRGANLQVSPLAPPPPPPPPPPVPGSPAITRIRNADGTPLAWPLVVGTEVQAEGQGFGAATGSLFVNGYPMPATAWTDTAVRFKIVADATRRCPGWVTVRRADGPEYSGNFRADGRGPVPEPPLFEAFYDAAGNRVTQAVAGTVLTLRGTHFGPRGLLVYAGWAVPEVVTWTETAITFKVPFVWWDQRVSAVEVLPANEDTAINVGPGARKGYWPAFTILPDPARPGPRPEARRR